MNAPAPQPTLTIRQNSGPDALRTRIAALDENIWIRRNAGQISVRGYQQIDRLERQSARLSRALPETQAQNAARAAKTRAQAALFERGRVLYREKQETPLSRARAGLAALTDPSLPPGLQRQITALLADIDLYMSQFEVFHPADGLPDALLRLLPPGERL